MRDITPTEVLGMGWLERATRQMSGIKEGEAVRVHINGQHILCVYSPSNELGCRGCVLNLNGVPCTKWVGDSVYCRLIPLEEAVE